ncbi:uncharacterized protein DS421_12g381320 [Arachis hypogaea]|nr:uncharacterized protein DS421_12g381320 [Arachis hypogaea]
MKFHLQKCIIYCYGPVQLTPCLIQPSVYDYPTRAADLMGVARPDHDPDPILLQPAT